MSDVVEEPPVSAGPPWYTKIFEYVKNRNRIGPGKVELPECDFFIVGPRRTLRVLLPTPKGSVYYEQNANERPETIDENFVSRWAMRPHPSGNCRCSFRQSNNRFSTNEDRIICAEINRIRTSLCEAEKIGEDIEILEQRISLNLEGLSDNSVITRDLRSDVDEKLAEIANVGPPIGSKNDDDIAIKNKIVKDLEKYIDVLLQEVLNDTMKFFSDAGDTLKRSRDVLKNGKECESVCFDPEHLNSCKSLKSKDENNIDEKVDRIIFEDKPSSFDISFAFHEGEETKKIEEQNGSYVNRAFSDATKETEESREIKEEGGYVNRAFSGSANDPDSLDFDLRKPVSAEMTIDNLDCVDSGINSVETIEFQTSQEPSLEQSLMEIIDAKFGRSSSKRNWENSSKTVEDKKSIETNLTNIENTETTANTEIDVSRCNGKEDIFIIDKNDDEEAILKIKEVIEPVKNDLSIRNIGQPSEGLDDTNDHSSFDKLRLELLGSENGDKKTSTVTSLREKFAWKLGCRGRDIKNVEKAAGDTKTDEILQSPVELRVKNEKVWNDIGDPSMDCKDENSVDFVKFRKSKKPTIVFLHGFGSSAEIFEHQLEYFSNLGYPCIAPEMLGHGMSSAPDRSRDYHFEKLLKDLELVLEHYAFGVGRKCVLVAHNYGCSFATALACKYDSNIHQLVLISGGGPTPLAPPSTEGAGHCCLRAMLTPLLMCGLHRDILYSARGRQHPYCGSEPPEQWPSHMKYVLDGMVWPEGDYVFHRRICTPTLLIHGLRDNKVSLVQECQMERTIIKAFLDAIPTAGHTPMTDCPEQVNHMIHCFIDLWKRKKR